MAKIAVLFLLVALFAICNGARLRRDEPKTPDVGIDFQPLLNGLKQVFNQENFDKLKAQTDSLLERARTETDESVHKLADFGQKLLDTLKEKSNTPK